MSTPCPKEFTSWLEALAKTGRSRFNAESNKRACGPWSFEFNGDAWSITTDGRSVLFGRCESDYPEAVGLARDLLVERWMIRGLEKTEPVERLTARELTARVREAGKERGAVLRVIYGPPGTYYHAHFSPKTLAAALAGSSSWLRSSRKIELRVADATSLVHSKFRGMDGHSAFVNGSGWGLLVLPLQEPDARSRVVVLGRKADAAAA